MTRKKKKVNVIFILFIVILAVGVIAGAPYIKEFVSSTTVEGETVTVEIPMGASSEQIGEILKEHKLIKSVNIFKIRAKMIPDGAKMNYGTFNLHKGMCIPDIIGTLAGKYAYRPTVKFTVPEGFSVQQIAKRCAQLGICSVEDFLAAAEKDYDYEFLKDAKKAEGVHHYLQGFLYPETYEFFADAEPEEIIVKMLDQFEKEIREVKIPADKSIFEIVTVASLLERESLLTEEMPVIAGVIYNRLEKGMRLQIDATVQYAVTNGEYDITRVTYDDLEINSPYNTYRISKLPAGPISSVSIKAIEAAANPQKHKYLYYHTDNVKNDGSHIFTETYEQHLATMN